MQRYISLDFETTGLNTQKDDPIQIGFVIFDATGTLHASYSSLIKPNKPIQELKEIVQYVTGFDMRSLHHAPTHTEVFAQVREYLTHDLVMVGHNVSFDLALLQRFVPNRCPKSIIDTFDCARQLLHFQQSYALDAIIHLDQQQQIGIFTTIQGKAHDALYDATASMQLFLRWHSQVKKIANKYPILSYSLSKNEITGLLFQQLGTFDFQLGAFSLPPLQSLSSGNTKIITQEKGDLRSEIGTRGNIQSEVQEIGSLISNLGPPCILAVNHPSKIAILKMLLQQQGITAHDSVHDLPKLNLENARKFLQKSAFTRPEIGFLLKYFSQLEKGHSLIDCKSVDDYKILNAITDLSSTKLESITLCTHQHLRSFAHKIEAKTQVYFFDTEHRLSSYLHSLQQPIDLLHLINLVDQLSYRYALEENETLTTVCKQLVIQLCMFSARFHTHIGKYLTNTNVTTMDCLSLSDDTLDPHARQLLGEINHYLESYKEQISSLHQGQLCITQRERCVAILAEPFVIEKKTFGDDRYCTFHAPAYHVTYEDFLESLPKAEYVWIKSVTSYQPLTISKLDQNFQSLNTLLNQNKNLFLLCQSKPFSKGLFDWMIQQKIDQTYTILAENITGGTGKALLFAKKSKKPILMIGSENYYYAAVGGGISFNHIGMWYYKPDRVDLLMADLAFYTI